MEKAEIQGKGGGAREKTTPPPISPKKPLLPKDYNVTLTFFFLLRWTKKKPPTSGCTNTFFEGRGWPRRRGTQVASVGGDFQPPPVDTIK